MRASHSNDPLKGVLLKSKLWKIHDETTTVLIGLSYRLPKRSLWIGTSSFQVYKILNINTRSQFDYPHAHFELLKYLKVGFFALQCTAPQSPLEEPYRTTTQEHVSKQHFQARTRKVQALLSGTRPHTKQWSLARPSMVSFLVGLLCDELYSTPEIGSYQIELECSTLA